METLVLVLPPAAVVVVAPAVSVVLPVSVALVSVALAPTGEYLLR
jgi:hypothetical protein